jgi:hypothetical protein
MKPHITIAAKCLVIILLAMACNKTENPSPANGEYRIKQRTTNSGSTVTYEYTANNLLSKKTYNGEWSEKSLYNSQDKLISFQVSGHAPGGPSNYSSSFVYSSAGAISEIISTYLDDASQEAGKQKITYKTNTDGLPIEIRFFNWNKNTATWTDGSLIVKLSYNEAKQPVKIETFNNLNFSTGATTYSYDPKGNQNEIKEYRRKPDNAFYLYYQYNATYDDKKAIAITSVYPEYYHNKNNPVDITSKTFGTDGTISSQNAVTYTYLYNEKGYVTQRSNNGTVIDTYILEKVK